VYRVLEATLPSLCHVNQYVLLLLLVFCVTWFWSWHQLWRVNCQSITEIILFSFYTRHCRWCHYVFMLSYLFVRLSGQLLLPWYLMIGSNSYDNKSAAAGRPMRSSASCPLWCTQVCIINLPTKFEVYVSTHYEDMKGDIKCRKWGGFG